MARERRRRRAPSRSAPKWLVDQVARKLWTALHDDMTSARFLASTDHAALGRYCQYMADWIALTKLIQEEGWTYTTSSEHVEDMRRPNPAVRFRRETESALKALEDSLGLNPRYRMAITQALLSLTVGSRQPDLLAGSGEPAPGEPPDLVDSKAEWEGILSVGGKAH